MLKVLRKIQPIYRLSNGKLYVKSTERVCKKRTDSERVIEGEGDAAKVWWFLPIEVAEETLPIFNAPSEGEA